MGVRRMTTNQDRRELAQMAMAEELQDIADQILARRKVQKAPTRHPAQDLDRRLSKALAHTPEALPGHPDAAWQYSDDPAVYHAGRRAAGMD